MIFTLSSLELPFLFRSLRVIPVISVFGTTKMEIFHKIWYDSFKFQWKLSVNIKLNICGDGAALNHLNHRKTFQCIFLTLGKCRIQRCFIVIHILFFVFFAILQWNRFELSSVSKGQTPIVMDNFYNKLAERERERKPTHSLIHWVLQWQ